MPASLGVEHLENAVRTTANTKRIRVNGFFMDFDKLRSGYVTESQFFRTIWQNLGVKFSAEEERMIADKYDIHRNGRINWKLFCDQIEGSFDPTNFRQDPNRQPVETPGYLGTLRSVRPLTPTSEERLLRILQRMNQFYTYHGVSLRQQYRDFDQHNVGIITESQFYRAFPGPQDIQDTEISLLARKYGDPDRPGLVNYLNLHHDLLYLVEVEKEKEEGGGGQGKGKRADALPQDPSVSPSVQMILDRIRVAVHKNGIRTLDFFRDYDKLRHDRIPETQFVSALTLAVGKEAQITRPEIQMLANFYRADDGRVKYRDFCQAMDSPFCVLHMEKNPLVDAPFPPSGSLGRALQYLSPSEEARVNVLLEELSNQVRKRRILIYPYFKDYDRSTANTRLMTANQFVRMLTFLRLDVSDEDGKLLSRKFADPTTGDVNYPAFVQCVDEQYCGQTVDPEDPVKEVKPVRDWQVLVTPIVKTVGDDVDFDTLMARIRHIILTNRIRIKPFFEDFDTLRSGKMSLDQFRRCLTQIGLSKLGMHDLTDRQYDTLLSQYQAEGGGVRWIDFVRDVDSVFTQNGLEQVPTATVPPQDVFVAPKSGTMDWNNASDKLREVCDEAMARMRLKVAERRMLVKPDFQAFDKLNHGHVTLQNFRQCMIMLAMNLDDEEMDAVAARFADDEGFNYFAFLKELDPPPPAPFMYLKRLTELREVNSKKGTMEMEPVLRDTEAVMDKVKTQVFRRRLRLSEFFRDHDKLRRGRMDKMTFRRALNTATIILPETELSLIEDRFCGPERESVDWMGFCEEVEAIFATKHLEKDPLKDPSLFLPPPDVYTNSMTPEEAEVAQNAVNKIGDKVRQRRIQLAPHFKDFDQVNTATLYQNQFRRVLTCLDLGSLLTEAEWAAIYKRFRHPMGTSDDVNYLAFSDAVYAAGGFEYRMP